VNRALNYNKIINSVYTNNFTVKHAMEIEHSIRDYLVMLRTLL